MSIGFAQFLLNIYTTREMNVLMNRLLLLNLYLVLTLFN
ncbi:MAG: hypothetical protein JWQ06_1607 [Mucilaginibacter sp.]|nr:hypothetical protein [Mucilaginibacter sp.]